MNDQRNGHHQEEGAGNREITPRDGFVEKGAPGDLNGREEQSPAEQAPVVLPEPSEDIWGSQLLAKRTYSVIRTMIDKPDLDKKFIMAVAAAGDPNGEKIVENQCTDQFNAIFADHIMVLRHIEPVLISNLRGVTRHLNDLSRILSSTLRYHDDTQEFKPWSLFERFSAALCIIFFLLCTLAGANTPALTMVASGVPGFDNYCRNLLFTFLVVACPVIIEIFVREFSEGAKRFLRRFILILAFASFVTWVFAFARQFSLGGLSAADLADRIVHSNSDGAQAINILTISQMFSEVLIAASCALELHRLWETHRRSSRKLNPQIAVAQNDVDDWQIRQRDGMELLGALRGRIATIEHDRSVFVRDGVQYYKVARKRMQILEQE